jgi:hypothetical protein
MKLNVTGKAAVLAMGTLLMLSPARINAQQDTSRQERIREHQDRIQKIIEESRKRREDQQKAATAQSQSQPPAAPGSPAGNAAGSPIGNAAGAPPSARRPGQPLPTGPVQNARLAPPVQKAAQTPAAQAPQTARSESRTILMFHPIDSIVAMGERFKTDVVAETKEGEIDEVSFLIKYPRHLLNPLGLSHAPLDPYVKNSIDYEFDPDKGTIYLHAKLKEPSRFSQKAIASIVWEALEPTDGSVISYEFGEKKTTGLYLKGSNLLGTLPGSEDGVIKSTVQITGPKQKPTVTQLSDGILIGAEERAIDDRPQDTMKIVLKQKATIVRAGETFDVDVYLNNPGEKLVDRLRLYLQFNPAELQVVDRDAGNVVTRGINIYDAPARSDFPFDYYRYNYADNDKGVIVYEVSASNSKVRGTGKIATIQFKALKDSPRAEVVLVQNAEGMVPTTDVSFLGKSRLQSKPGEAAVSLAGSSLQISGQVASTQASQSQKQDVYSPFESQLAQRMRNKTD